MICSVFVRLDSCVFVTRDELLSLDKQRHCVTLLECREVISCHVLIEATTRAHFTSWLEALDKDVKY